MRVIPDTNVWITWSARAPEAVMTHNRADFARIAGVLPVRIVEPPS